MSIIIDIVVVAIFLICILMGYKKGLTGSLLKIISFVLAIVVAFILFKPIAGFVIEKTNWDEQLEQSIRGVIQNEQQEENQQDKKTQENLPDVITNYINDSVEKASNEVKQTVADATAKNVTITIINAGVWIALFIIARILLLFVKGIAELLTNLPIIGQVDKLGGIIYGLLEALAIIYIILAIISFAAPMLQQSGFIEALQKSYVTSIMYNNNLLLKIIF